MVDLNGAGGDGIDFAARFPGEGDFIVAMSDLEGTPRDDTLIGTGDDDTLTGGPGSDLLIGGPGMDTLIGGGTVPGDGAVPIADASLAITDVDDANIQMATITLTGVQDYCSSSISGVRRKT